MNRSNLKFINQTSFYVIFTILALTSLLDSKKSYSQTNSQTNSLAAPSETTAERRRRNSAEAIKWIYRRIEKIDIGAIVNWMNANGAKSANYLLDINVEGSLINEADFHGEGGTPGLGRGYSKAGRGTGLNMLPFQVSISPLDGRVFVATDLFAFRNMHAGNIAGYDSGYGNGSNFWNAVDRVGIIGFEYDRGYTHNNLNSIVVKLMDMDFHADIKKFANEGNFIAFKGNITNGIAWEKFSPSDLPEINLNAEQYNYTVDGNGDLLRKSYVKNSPAYKFETTAGILYQWESANKKHIIDIDGFAQFGTVKGSMFSQPKYDEAFAKTSVYREELAAYNEQITNLNQGYSAASEAWDHAKLEFQIARNETLSDSQYLALNPSAGPRPVKTTAPDAPANPSFDSSMKDTRYHMYFRAGGGFEYKAKVSGPRAAQKVFLGIGVKASIPVVDFINSPGAQQDLRGFTRDVIRAKLFINF